MIKRAYTHSIRTTHRHINRFDGAHFFPQHIPYTTFNVYGCKDWKHSVTGWLPCDAVCPSLASEKSSKVRYGHFNRQSTGWRDLKRLFTSARFLSLSLPIYKYVIFSRTFAPGTTYFSSDFCCNGNFQNCNSNPLSFELSLHWIFIYYFFNTFLKAKKFVK